MRLPSEMMRANVATAVISRRAGNGMTAADLVGRWLLDAEGTVWSDGPLTTAVRLGAICYLDEIVEARQDTTVVIHPLTDDRRVLPLEKRGELIHAHSDFQLVISYNPGYQSAIKDLKESTKQRFAALDFGYPDRPVETEVVSREAGIEPNLADLLVKIAQHSRNLKGQGLDEGASTRMLVNSSVGNVIVATRENPQRAEMLGYDVRKYQLLTFVIGSGLAGLSGALYTSWGQFITPSSIGLPAAAMPIVWVAFSGRNDLTATLVGSFLLLFGFQTITVYSQQAALVLMGVLLLATVMLAPQGFVLGIGKLVVDWWTRRRRRDEAPALADTARLQSDET